MEAPQFLLRRIVFHVVARLGNDVDPARTGGQAVEGGGASSSRSRLEERIHKRFSVEWSEVGFLLSGADKADGNSQFMLKGDRDAALATPVQLGENSASEADRLVKFTGLDEGVGACAGIHNDPFFMGSRGVLP